MQIIKRFKPINRCFGFYPSSSINFFLKLHSLILCRFLIHTCKRKIKPVSHGFSNKICFSNSSSTIHSNKFIFF